MASGGQEKGENVAMATGFCAIKRCDVLRFVEDIGAGGIVTLSVMVVPNLGIIEVRNATVFRRRHV
jgi:hypothetical protein